VQLEHVLARHHGGLVHQQHGAAKPSTRRLVSWRIAFGNEAFMRHHERGNGLRLYARAFAKIGDHLVLEGETDDRPIFGLRDPGDRLQHGRFAGAGHALDRNRPVTRGQDHGSGRELSRIERSGRGVLQARGSGFGRHDWGGEASACIDRRQDLVFGLQRLGGRHHAPGPLGGAGHAGDELPVLDKMTDAPFDAVDCDIFQPQIERGLGDEVSGIGGFTLGKDADGGSDGKLRARFGWRFDHASERIVDKRVAGSQHASQPLARRIDRGRDCAIAALDRAWRMRQSCPGLRGQNEVLAVKTKRAGTIDPVLPERRAIFHPKLGIA